MSTTTTSTIPCKRGQDCPFLPNDCKYLHTPEEIKQAQDRKEREKVAKAAELAKEECKYGMACRGYKPNGLSTCPRKHSPKKLSWADQVPDDVAEEPKAPKQKSKPEKPKKTPQEHADTFKRWTFEKLTADERATLLRELHTLDDALRVKGK